MSTPFTYRTPSSIADLRQLGLILCQSFNTPPTLDPSYLNRLGMENVRVLCDGDYPIGGTASQRIIGGLGIVRLGQWYNGVRLPMAGVAAVGIAPEYRGQGTAFTLLKSVLQELHEQETPISVLYSAAQPLYRKLGYEQAGTLCLWEVPTETIQLRDYSLPMQPIAIETIQSEFAALYQQQAQAIDGHLDRNDMIWQMLQDSHQGMPAHAYRIGNEGYIIFWHQSEGGKNQILVRDWVALTPAAARRLWTFLGDHRSQIDTVLWRSAPIDTLSFLLPEQTAKVKSIDRWMLRIVSIKAALEHRRYPDGIEAELHLDIYDPLLESNTGKFVLSVANGVGNVSSGGRGELAIDINALAPLYTGLFSPEQLQRSGKITVTEAALIIAKKLFSASTPWMPDFF